MSDFLTEIIAAKKKRLSEAKRGKSEELLREEAWAARRKAKPYALRSALKRDQHLNVIAEFKRRSPSRGVIRGDADAVAIARAYEAAGAVAVSVLTEEDYFDGSLDDLRAVRGAISLPILRKDFIFDEYQVYEAAAAGADALLLIVAVLDDGVLVRLRKVAEDDLQMDVLVEVHTREELNRAIRSGAPLIGVNNRDLRTFRVLIATSEELARAAPRDAILVSESGLNPETARKLRAIGYKGFLVGEAFMSADDPLKALRDFIQGRARTKLHYATGTIKTKICGITNIADARAAVAAGADMLGFNFYRPSPRFIEPQNARAIIDALRAETDPLQRDRTMVGVFVNEPAESVVRVAQEAGLDAVQLHGDESVEFCEHLKRLLPDRFLIKVISMRGDDLAEQMTEYDVDAIMLDAFDAVSRGGTGRTIDWAVARRARARALRLFLAGGLSPENVAEAIAEVQPYAVDACSSLETSPGRKDTERIKAFVRAVHRG